MNTERLLKVYNQISAAPDAITRLRRCILDLAVRGKLVEPILAENTGEELSRRILADKAKKAKNRLIKPAQAPKGATRETALEVPEHWQPLLMADILDELQTGPFGSSLKKSDYAVGGVPVINPASILNEAIRPVAEMAVDARTLERLASFKLRQGDIVMARRGEMGRCALVGAAEAGWLCGTGSLILRPSPLLFAQYLVLLIGSPYSRNYLTGSAVGATMQNLNQNILLSMPVGLPPEAEQNRIVAKVDELMALCDQLEEARKTREETRDNLTTASLARLTSTSTDAASETATSEASEDDDFASHARFALETLPALTARPDQIKALRQTILNLAVRGKLVEPILTESTGEQLAQRIRADKATKEKAGLIKPAKAPKGAARETTMKIPEHWQLLLMADLLDELQTGPFGSSLKKSDYTVGGVPVINPASILNGAIRPVAEMAVGARTLERLASFKLQQGDIVMARRGEMGRCALVGEIETGWLCGTGSLILRPSKFMFAQYLVLLIGSPYSRNYLTGSAVGATMQNLNQNILLSMPIGLPPEGEQRRIVAKVDALMALCDRLEAALTEADTKRTRLLEALLHEALQPAEAKLEAAE